MNNFFFSDFKLLEYTQNKKQTNLIFKVKHTLTKFNFEISNYIWSNYNNVYFIDIKINLLESSLFNLYKTFFLFIKVFIIYSENWQFLINNDFPKDYFIEKRNNSTN